MADAARALDVKERWLTLSDKWLRLSEEIGGEVVQFDLVLGDKGTGQQSSGSRN
jgi:hypothetical protein